MIQHVIFDLGRVLVEVDLKPFTAEFCRAFQIDPLALKSDQGNGAYLDFQLGKITGEEFHRRTCEHYGRFISLTQFKEIWLSMLGGPVPGTSELVDRIDHRGYALSLLSNTDPWHFEYCHQTIPALQRFDRLFLSYELNKKKPDAEIFWAVAEGLKAKPHQCLFIDDLEENIEGAKRIGYQTILFRNAEMLKRELELLSLI